VNKTWITKKITGGIIFGKNLIVQQDLKYEEVHKQRVIKDPKIIIIIAKKSTTDIV
jgi:hypothetical protein